MKSFGIKTLLSLIFIVAVAVEAFAANIRITDVGGQEVQLGGAGIDYSVSGPLVIFPENRKEYEGIKVSLGEGVILIKWSDIDSVAIMQNDKQGKQYLKGEFLLKDGRKISADIVAAGNKRLFGVSDLGDYSIELEKVRTIITIKEPAGKKTKSH